MKLSLTLAAVLAAVPALSEPLNIVAVNAPLADFAQTLGGDDVSVTFPVPLDRDPALWRPGIADISAIQGADLVLLNGAEYAAWTTKASLSRRKTLLTTAGREDQFIPVANAVTHAHGPDGEHSHTGFAATTWLDFDLAAYQAQAIADKLTDLLETDADIAAASATLQSGLAALSQRANDLGSGISGTVISSHPRFQYLFKALGVDGKSVSWAAGAAPTADDLSSLTEVLAGSPDARLFLFEAEPQPDALKAITERDLVPVVFLPGDHLPEDKSFIETMSDNLDRLEAALNGL